MSWPFEQVVEPFETPAGVPDITGFDSGLHRAEMDRRGYLGVP